MTQSADHTERQSALLQAIVQEYIKTARPVGSQVLVEEYGFEFSPATIRNDMAALEEGGYIRQPHTSAGRIPTEKGYQYYIQHFLAPKELRSAQKAALSEVVRQPSAIDRTDRNNPSRDQQWIQQLAKTLSALTNDAVIVSADGDQLFYTGMSHMFRQPEFSDDSELLVSIGEVFDRMDETMKHMRSVASDNVQVLVGKQNPLSHQCSMVLSEYEFGNGRSTVVSIFGPMRMNYDQNVAILEYIETVMKQLHEPQQE